MVPGAGGDREGLGCDGAWVPPGPRFPTSPCPPQPMAAPADPSLLSAELEAEEGDDEALRRLLLQVGPGWEPGGWGSREGSRY